jgi:hypothetical protein
MARQFVTVIFGAVVALGCVTVVGATIAWSNIAGPAGNQAYMTTADFDRAFTDTVVPESPAPIREKLLNAGWKRFNGQTLLQSFWVAAIASPYLGAKDAELLRPFDHLLSLRTGNISPMPSTTESL